MDKWYACLEEIRACHSLPAPSEDEKLPVGTGSNPVSIHLLLLAVSDLELSISNSGMLVSCNSCWFEILTP